MSVGISINPVKKAEAKARVRAAQTAQQYASIAPSAPSAPSAPAPAPPKTWDEAAQQTAAQLGVKLPSDFKKTVQFAAQKYLWNTAWGSFDQMLVSKKDAFNEYNGVQAVKTYAENPAQLYRDALYGAGLRYQNVSQFGAPDKQAALDEAKGAIQNFAQNAAKLGVSTDDIQNTIRSGAQSQIDFYKNMPRESGMLDSAIGLAISGITGVATGGLSLPAQVAAQAVVSLGQGVSVEDTIKNIGATLAGNQVVEALKGVSSQIANPELKAAFNGAAQGATTALLLGKDITQAALISAGVSAGTTAAERMTDSAGTGLKMPGQVAAPSAAGEASLRTDIAGTAPEIGTGTGLYASPTALLTKQLAPYSTQIGDVISGGDGTLQSRYTSAADIITPSFLSQYLPEYQPPESTSGSMQRGLDPAEKKALSEALKLGFSSLFDKDTGGGGAQTTYAATDTQRPTALPAGQYTPGSQALAQALRIGDVGAPIFGTDKDEGKKAGWNVESLRYMGNVGEA